MRKIFLLALFALILGGYLVTLRTHPPGLLNDETDIGYEAYSLLQTGRDQWGHFLPITYFSGFGGTRLPLLIYWTVPFIKTLGLSFTAVRLSGVMAAMLVISGFYLLTRNRLATVALALTPWFWGLSRITNEAVLGLAFTLLGVFFLRKAETKPKLLFLSAFSFGLSAYSYYSNQVFVPVFLLLYFLYHRKAFTLNLKTKLAAAGLLIFLVLPLVIPIFRLGGSATRLNQTSLLSNISLVGQLNEKRSDCQEYAPAVWCRFIYNKPTLWAGEIIGNYLDHFSPTFLFRDNLFIGALPTGRLFYLVLLPGLVVSFYFIIKKRLPDGNLWLSWLVAAPVADSLTGTGNGMRALLMVPAIVILATTGWEQLINQQRSIAIRKILTVLVISIFLLETGYFLSGYWRNFPKRNSEYSHYPYIPLMQYLFGVENQYPAIYLSNEGKGIQQYSFYLFYRRYDPAVFQQKSDVTWQKEEDGWIRISQIGKWHFVKQLPKPSDVAAGSLLIGNKDEAKALLRLPGKYEILKTINFLNNDPAFVIIKVEEAPTTQITDSI